MFWVQGLLQTLLTCVNGAGKGLYNLGILKMGLKRAKNVILPYKYHIKRVNGRWRGDNWVFWVCGPWQTLLTCVNGSVKRMGNLEMLKIGPKRA